MTTPIAVVTGAAGGLGQATARHLLAAGFDVVAVTRDATSAEATRQALAADAPGRTVHALHADLVDRTQVRDLTRSLRRTAGGVDVLINNAGAAFPAYAETADGAERTHALNHHAPFRLTHLLLADDLLRPTARIITISSNLVTRGRFDAADPDVTGTTWRDRFAQLDVYGTAKLMNLMATAALAARLPAGMSAYSANPGVFRSGFNTKAGGMLKMVAPVAGLFTRPPHKAARTPVLLATAPEALSPNGGFFAKGASAAPPEIARDAALASEIYERTARVLDIEALPARRA